MSDLEEAFAFQLSAIGLDGFVRESRAIPERRFRFDFAFVPERVLIEIQGGTWNRGAHSRGAGLARDYEKLNLSTSNVWRVLQFDTNMIKSGEAIRMAEQILKGAK